MVGEVSHNVREAVAALDRTSLDAAVGHITVGTEMAISALADDASPNAEAIIDVLGDIAEKTGRMQRLLFKGAAGLTRYADFLDGTATPPSAPRPFDLPEVPETRAWHRLSFTPDTAFISPPRTHRLSLKDAVYFMQDEIQRQYEQGTVDQSPLLTTFDRPLEEYADEDEIEIGPIVHSQNLMLMDTPEELANALRALDITTNTHFEFTDDEVVVHEMSHAAIMKVLQEQYGNGVGENKPGAVKFQVGIKITGDPQTSEKTGKLWIPHERVIITVQGDIKIPVIAIALSSMFPADPSRGDKSNIHKWGYTNKNDVLKRVREFNQRPGVKPLPLPPA
jgi:hypothetical protein